MDGRSVSGNHPRALHTLKNLSMRRGDFVRHNWVMEPSIKAHLRRIRGKLQIGRDKLRYLHNIPHKTYDVPDPHPNQLAHRREAPYIDDP